MVGYRIEYSARSQAKCQRKELCDASKILKGELRFGTYVVMKSGGDERPGFKWRHWYCMTPAVLKNVLESLEGKGAEELDGFEDLQPEDQTRVKAAIESGQIDPADIPATANQPKSKKESGEDGEKPKKRKRAPKKTAEPVDEETENVDDEPKTKAKRPDGRKKVWLMPGQTLEPEEGEPKPKAKRPDGRKKVWLMPGQTLEPEEGEPKPKAKRVYKKKKVQANDPEFD